VIKELVLFAFPKFVSGRGEVFILSGKTLDHILIYIQQDTMLHSLFYLETALHVSGGTLCSTKIKRPDISYVPLRQSRDVQLPS